MQKRFWNPKAFILHLLVCLVVAPAMAVGEEPEAAREGQIRAAGNKEADKESFLEKLAGLTKGESISLEGKAYVRYWLLMQDRAVGDDEPYDNSFELWRFYIGVKAKLAPWLKVRFTADVGPEKEEGGEKRYELYVKYAWFDARLVDGLHIRAGLIDNPYNSFTDKFWGYRYVFKNVGDEEKLWDGADLGLYLKYELPVEMGEIVAGLVNGSGYKHALDQDGSKDLWAHIMLHPFAALGETGKGFSLGGYLKYPLTRNDEIEKELFYSLFVGYAHEWFSLGYQFLSGHILWPDTEEWEVARETLTGRGHALYFRFDMPWKVGLLARFGTWDEDVNEQETRAKYQFLYGISYSPLPLLSVATTFVTTWWSESDKAGDEEKEWKLLLSTQFKF